VQHYMEKLSGPLLDRIDIQVAVQSVDYSTMKQPCTQESSKDLFRSVCIALDRQRNRFGCSSFFNSFMSTKQVEQFCVLTPAAESVLKKAFDVLRMSMRGYHKILKVARTIADCDSCDMIDIAHIQEAVMYRSLDQHKD